MPSRFVIVGGLPDAEKLKRYAHTAIQHFPGPYISASMEQIFGMSTAANDVSVVSHEAGLLFFDGLIWTEMSHKADAEEVLHRILREGFNEAIASLNGDFACAWLDKKSLSVYLARDRFGKRPLYFCKVTDSFFAVASQPGALLRIDGVSREVNMEFAIRYGAMHYRMIDNDLESSPYRSIQQVAPGQIVKIDKKSQVSKFKFWNMTVQPEFDEADRDVLADEYRHLLLSSVQSRIKRLSRPIYTLSGGMDSSSVLASAVALSEVRQPAVSSVYEDSTYDERNEISDMLQNHVSEWSQVEISNQLDLVDEVDKLIAIHDEPVATATWLSHRRICQRVSEAGYTAVLGGLGGDELNVGEYEYFPFYFADLAARGNASVLELEIGEWVRLHDHSIFKKSAEIARESMSRVTDSSVLGRNLVDPLRIFRYRSVLSEDFQYLKQFSPIVETVFNSYLKNRMWQDMSRETLPCCLRSEDRNSAAFGLTPVTPFLDNALVEFMFRVPSSLNIRNGVTKQLLRQAMKGLLPENTRTRVKKTGWNAPAHVWFAGRGAQMLLDLVESDEFRQLGIYDAGRMKQVIEDHNRIVQSGLPIENHMMFLWSFVNLVRWQHWLSHLR